MRLAFAGTPEFARVALQRLHQAGHEISLVLTQPDRPAGRGMKLQPSPVKSYAQGCGLALAQPHSLRLDGQYAQQAQQAREDLLLARPEVMVVAAYGLILPQWALDLPHRGCLNIHGSLLPRWRGAAPIHRAIEAGDSETGITIMQMDAGLDTGDMLMTATTPIAESDTTATLHDRLADMGAGLIVSALDQLAAGGLAAVPQGEHGVTYANKIGKHEATIDWSQPAELIVRRIRAFNPFPGASTTLAGEVLKVWGAHMSRTDPGHEDLAQPGRIVAVSSDAFAVAAGRGSDAGLVWVSEIQRPGGKRMAVAEFLRGCKVDAGMLLGGN